MKQDEIIVMLNNLEMEIKRLRIEQNKTLAGSKESNLDFVEQRINEMIKRLNKTPFKKYIHKFRYENLVSRVNVMKINFNRMYGGREKKLSQVRKRLGLALGSTQNVQETDDQREDVSSVKIDSLGKGGQKKELKELFDRYISVSEESKVKNMKFDSFVEQIQNRLETVKLKHGDASLQLKLVKEGQTFKLKTKAVK